MIDLLVSKPVPARPIVHGLHSGIFGDPFGKSACLTWSRSPSLFPLSLPYRMLAAIVSCIARSPRRCFLRHFSVSSRITQTRRVSPTCWRVMRWKTFVQTRLRLSPGCSSRGEGCAYRYVSILLDFIPPPSLEEPERAQNPHNTKSLIE